MLFLKLMIWRYFLSSAYALAVCLSFQICTPVQAATIYTDHETNTYALGAGMEYIEDVTGQLSIHEILQESPSLQWQSSQQHNLNFGFSQSAYWFRIKLANQNHEPVKLTLAIDNPLLDEVTLYAYSNDKLVDSVNTGDALPFLQRPHQHMTFVFPVTIPAGQPTLLFIRVSSEGSVQVPFSLWNYEYFHHHEEENIVVQSIYFGVLIFMAVFNLFIYLRTFSASHLFFVLYVLSAGLLLAGLSGFGYKYVWQPFIHFQQHHIAILASLAGIFLSAFIYRFLGLRKKSSLAGKLLLIVIGAFVLLLLLTPVITYHLMVQIALLLLFIPLATGLQSGISRWNKSGAANIYFTLAWAQFLLLILAVQLAKFGIIERSFFTDDILPWSVLVQVLLLSMALGERMNGERRRRVEAQKQIIRMQKVHKKELELQVKERTVKLEEANKKLSTLATTDPLTNLYNRRHFLNRAEELINISIRYQHPIALAMIDIDFFKHVNDTYGHAAGDHVLCQLANMLSITTRKTDIIGRIGGEEFAIVLIDATPSMSSMLIERLRQAIESLQIVYEGQPIPLTISAGICTRTAMQKDVSTLEMMKIADDGLYQAKQSGRNRVVSLPLP